MVINVPDPYTIGTAHVLCLRTHQYCTVCIGSISMELAGNLIWIIYVLAPKKDQVMQFLEPVYAYTHILYRGTGLKFLEQESYATELTRFFSQSLWGFQ